MSEIINSAFSLKLTPAVSKHHRERFWFETRPESPEWQAVQYPYCFSPTDTIDPRCNTCGAPLRWTCESYERQQGGVIGYFEINCWCEVCNGVETSSTT